MGYKKDYIKIYFYQAISLVLGFVSLFIVVPYVSSNEEIYGIYSICISLTVFFSYADLGFLSAGSKFATESYAKGNFKEEIKFTSSAYALFMVSMMLISMCILYFSYHPHKIIKGLNSDNQIYVAQALLLILAISAPLSILVRLPLTILSIRISQHFYQKYQIIGNGIKIASVLYFFRSGSYNIIGYYGFIQLINVLVGIYTCIVIRKRYSYDFKYFIKSFKIQKKTLRKIYPLALSSLFVTLCWVLYYEMDNLAIGKMFGARQVAQYAIGFTLLNFIRNLLGIIYSPFSNRFFQFVGEGDQIGLKKFYRFIVYNMAFVIIPPLLIISFDLKAFILSWVGVEYSESVLSAQLLVLCNLMAFISYPGGILLYATEKIKYMYFLNGANLLLFWIGIIVLSNSLQYEAFSFCKFLTFVVSGFFYLIVSINYLKIKWKNLLVAVFNFIIVSCVCLIIVILTRKFLLYSHSHASLFFNLCIMALQCLIFYGILILCFKRLRNNIKSIIKA